jgi:hypothetical protein
VFNLKEYDCDLSRVFKYFDLIDQSVCDRRKGLVIVLQNSKSCMEVTVLNKSERFRVFDSADVGRPQYLITMKVLQNCQQIFDVQLKELGIYSKVENDIVLCGHIENEIKNFKNIGKKELRIIFDNYFKSDYKKYFCIRPFGLFLGNLKLSDK